MEKNYLIYNNTDSSDNTVGKFFYRNDKLMEGVDIILFLKYDGGTGKSNAERIKETFTKWQAFFYEPLLNIIQESSVNNIHLSENDINNIPFNLNTKILLPKDNFKAELTFIKGKNFDSEQKDSAFFFSEKLLQLLNDPGYVRSENLVRESRDYSVEIINENCQVFLWSRALGKILDISVFIQSLSTSKSEVGSFNFSLSPIHSLEDINFINDQDILNYFVLNNDKKNNIDFFYKNIQYNDIVFVRFEKLKLEEDEKLNKDSIIIDQSKLPGKVWDMIGLVDSVSQSSIYSGVDYTINVSGRDFYKLLIEDGSYFLSLRYLNNGQSEFAFEKSDKWFKRNIGDSNGNSGTFEYYDFPNSFRRIDDTVSFIINQLSNIEILPSNQNIFSNYGDRRSKRYILSEEDSTIETDEIIGIWQIIKLMIDERLEDRRIVDSSLAYVDSTMLDQFNKICQKPFVEFFGDTFGDEYNFIVRKPPFTKELIYSFLNPKKSLSFKHKLQGNYQIIELDEKDIEGYNNLEWDDTFYSWYEIQPKDNMLGQFSSLMHGGLVGIIYFDKLCQYYGNKRLVVPDNYLSMNCFSSIESNKDLNYYRKFLFDDLKYLIDSNSYLPFTRRGSITLPKGDRRIKRGTFIRINPTKEIFYVDSVSNSLTFSKNKVDRSTTLQLSRGMIENYIYGDIAYDDNGNPVRLDKKFSYFDIIKTEVISDKLETEYEESSNDYVSKNNQEYSVKINSFGPGYRNNNPGNLEFRNQPDAVPGEFRRKDDLGRDVYWAKFNTPEIGFENVIRQLKINRDRDDLTIEQLVYKYSPPSDNRSKDLLDFYISRLNIPPLNNVTSKTKLSSVDLFEFAKLIVLLESSTTVTKRDSVVIETGDKKEIKKLKKIVYDYKFTHKLNEDQLDFFMKRQQFNCLKNDR